jgi:hypothetical protein
MERSLSQPRHLHRRFAGCGQVSDYESWIGSGRAGSTAVMNEWQEFVKNQLRLQGADMIGPTLVCINVQPYDTTQAPERSDNAVNKPSRSRPSFRLRQFPCATLPAGNSQDTPADQPKARTAAVSKNGRFLGRPSKRMSS